MLELPYSQRLPAPRWVITLCGASALLTALAILTIDAPVARAFAPYEPLALWDRGTEALEWAVALPLWRFAVSVAPVLGMLATVAVPRWRAHAPAWMFVAGVHLASRLTVNWCKDATSRLRPYQWLAHGGGDSFGVAGGISFPSGHVVLFASVALPLIVVVPRSRRLAAAMIAVVAFISLARIGVSAHFVSDTLGAITLVTAWMAVVGLAVRPRRACPR